MRDETKRMPFGKFRGQPVADLPDWYLSWLASLDDLRDPLLAAVEQECERRFGKQQDCGTNDELPDSEFAEQLIGAGVRSLARKYHPDVGGTNAQMQHVNAAAEWLRTQLKRLPA
jgi:hypothetical protein